jgi:hypothetical protein
VLYATGLERDRKQLLTLVQLVTRELASLHERNEMPVDTASAIQQLLTILNDHPLAQ